MRPGLFAVTVLTVMLGLPSDGLACICGGSWPCQTLSKSDPVFEATVQSIDPAPQNVKLPFAQQVIRLGDIRPLRGTAPAFLLVERTSCGYPFRVGRRYFIHGSRRADGTVGTSLCSSTRPIEHAPDLIRYIESLNAPDASGRLLGRLLVQSVIASSTETPISPAHVMVQGPVTRSAWTRSGGYFTVEGLPPGRYIVSVGLPSPWREHASVKELSFTLDGPLGCYEADLRPVIDSVLSGTVVDESGRALPDVSVYVVRPEWLLNPWGGGASMHKTDAAGRYAVSGLPPGQYAIAINPHLGPGIDNPYRTVYLRSPDGSPEVFLPLGGHLVLPPLTTSMLTPVRVEGVVLNTDGTPIVDVSVQAGPIDGLPAHWAKTDAAGRFVLNLFRNERFRVYVGGDFRRPLGTADLVDGEGPVLIIVRPQ